MSATPPGAAEGRHHHLDWLRAIAFGLLIAYHVGMAYVPWDWHVKSAYGSEAWRLPMLMVNPWRLALLFVISGVAVRFAADRMGSGNFAASRLLRLGVPIVFGMAVVVMPQSYFELLAAGEIDAGILAFWPRYLSLEQQFSILTPTWNHLWYVVYLLVYVLATAPLLPFLRWFADTRAFARLAGSPLAVLLLFALPFALDAYLLEPRFRTTHALVGDWHTLAWSGAAFVIGVLIAKSRAFWSAVRRGFWLYIATAALFGVWRLVVEADGGTEVPGWFLMAAAATWPLASVLYSWSVILGLFALAQRFLNRPSPLLTYVTGAVFCWYIVHQTIIVSLVALLTPRALGGPLELAIVAFGTAFGCFLSYETFRRIPVLRLAFGIKGQSLASRRVME